MTHSLEYLAEKVDGEILGDASIVIRGAAPFDIAGENEITYAVLAPYLKRLDELKAPAVIISKKNLPPEANRPSSLTILAVNNAELAFIEILNLFYPPKKTAPGIHEPVSIGEGFSAGGDVSVGPFVSIGNNVVLGDRVVLHPHVFIGDDVTIGDDTIIHPNTTIMHKTRIGKRVVIQSGSVIGSEGFGYVSEDGRHFFIPHMGIVQIDDDVEIGACNTIDRARFDKTWIKQGTKTDNLVQIGHNVIIGENTFLVSQVGISGSVTTGRNVIMAGQAGIAGHLHIGDYSVVGPQAGVGKDVEPRQIVSGSPAVAHRVWLRAQNLVPKLPDMQKKLSDFEKRLKKLEEQNGNTV